MVSPQMDHTITQSHKLPLSISSVKSYEISCPSSQNKLFTFNHLSSRISIVRIIQICMHISFQKKKKRKEKGKQLHIHVLKLIFYWLVISSSSTTLKTRIKRENIIKLKNIVMLMMQKSGDGDSGEAQLSDTKLIALDYLDSADQRKDKRKQQSKLIQFDMI